MARHRNPLQTLLNAFLFVRMSDLTFLIESTVHVLSTLHQKNAGQNQQNWFLQLHRANDLVVATTSCSEKSLNPSGKRPNNIASIEVYWPWNTKSSMPGSTALRLCQLNRPCLIVSSNVSCTV